MIHEKIVTKLKEALQPTHLEVINESHRHHVPTGSESHFKVIIVSDKFLEQTILTRHRTIYGILALELRDFIHALAIHAYTISEWDASQYTLHASPPCLNTKER